MSKKLYILDKHGKPKAVTDTMKWAAWFETYDRVIAVDDITSKIYVSTVFLGIDHNFTGEGPPVLWETMIFNGARDGYQERHASKRDALAGHERAIRVARGENDPPKVVSAKAKSRALDD
jgi:hypothetical protein